MTSKQFFEQTATTLAGLDKKELINRLKNFHGRFTLDFTDDYLGRLSDDRLRHILLAAIITAEAKTG